MEFTNLNDAIKYAQNNNMDLKKQYDKWVTVEKKVIPNSQIISDLEYAIKECDDKETKAEMQAELEKLQAKQEENNE